MILVGQRRWPTEPNGLQQRRYIIQFNKALYGVLGGCFFSSSFCLLLEFIMFHRDGQRWWQWQSSTLVDCGLSLSIAWRWSAASPHWHSSASIQSPPSPPPPALMTKPFVFASPLHANYNRERSETKSNRNREMKKNCQGIKFSMASLHPNWCLFIHRFVSSI